MNAEIKHDLDAHLSNTANQIKSHDGWNVVNIPEISELSLLSAAREHGLESDPQTRSFCKFISLGTNFSSLDFTRRFQMIPDLVASINELIVLMQAEIQEFAEIATFFSGLIQSFVKLVLNTKHNMRMAQPHLEESVVHMTIISEALMPDSAEPLANDDLNDVEIALNNMAFGKIF